MKKEIGFTLVELLIGLFLMSFAWVLAISIFGNQIAVVESMTKKIDVEMNIRHAFIVLEKQIEKSDILIYEKGHIYIRDLETAEYLNYYTLEGINLYKIKVNDDLNSIGLGSKSQIAANITFFSLEPNSEGGIILTIESTWDDEIYEQSKIIVPSCPVYTIG